MTTPSIASLRRRAAKLGFKIEKSNWRRDSIDNHGGYRIVDVSTNTVVDGVRFDLEIDYIADFIADQERDA